MGGGSEKERARREEMMRRRRAAQNAQAGGSGEKHPEPTGPITKLNIDKYLCIAPDHVAIYLEVIGNDGTVDLVSHKHTSKAKRGYPVVVNGESVGYHYKYGIQLKDCNEGYCDGDKFKVRFEVEGNSEIFAEEPP